MSISDSGGQKDNHKKWNVAGGFCRKMTGNHVENKDSIGQGGRVQIYYGPEEDSFMVLACLQLLVSGCWPIVSGGKVALTA